MPGQVMQQRERKERTVLESGIKAYGPRKLTMLEAKKLDEAVESLQVFAKVLHVNVNADRDDPERLHSINVTFDWDNKALKED